MEKIGNMQMTDNKENKFFCFPMISVACTGTGTSAGILQGAAMRNALYFGRYPELWSPERDTSRT